MSRRLWLGWLTLLCMGTLAEVAHADEDICWKRTYGRGAGYVLSECKPGYERSGAICYPPCKPGFYGVGPVCWQGCPSGYKDTGAFCDTLPHIYAKGTSWCKGGCKPGYNDDGCFCRRHHVFAKQSYGRGVGVPLVCASHLEQNGALCYPKCDAGFYGVGPVCWQNCEGEFPVSCAANCGVSSAACAEGITNMVVGPFVVVGSVASLVFTGGAGNAAIMAAKIAVSVAKMAAKAGVKAIIKAGLKAGASALARTVAKQAAKKVIVKTLLKAGKKIGKKALDKAAEEFMASSESGGGFTFDPKDLAALDPTGIASAVMAFVKPMCPSRAEAQAKRAKDAKEDRDAVAMVDRIDSEGAEDAAAKATQERKNAELSAQRARDAAARGQAQRMLSAAKAREQALQGAAQAEKKATVVEASAVRGPEEAVEKAKASAAKAEAEAAEARKYAQIHRTAAARQVAQQHEAQARKQRAEATAAYRRLEAAGAEHAKAREVRTAKLRESLAQLAKATLAKGAPKTKPTMPQRPAVSEQVRQKLNAAAPIADLVAAGFAQRTREAVESARLTCADKGPSCFAAELKSIGQRTKERGKTLAQDLGAVVKVVSSEPVAKPSGGSNAPSQRDLARLTDKVLPQLRGQGKILLSSEMGTQRPAPPQPTPVAKADPKLGVNLAVGQRASQSSTAAGGNPARAVDGNTNGTYGRGSVTHTAAEADPYWQVDLGRLARVNKIRIFNRTDCCQDRLGTVRIFVSRAHLGGISLAEALAQKDVWQTTAEIKKGEQSLTVDVDTEGRFVRVQLPGKTRVLSLAEVEVLGVPTRARSTDDAKAAAQQVAKVRDQRKANVVGPAQAEDAKSLTAGLPADVATKVVADAKGLGHVPASAAPEAATAPRSRKAVVSALDASVKQVTEVSVPAAKEQAPVLRAKAGSGGKGVRAALGGIYTLSLNDWRAGIAAAGKLERAARSLPGDERAPVIRSVRAYRSALHGAFRLVYIVRRMQLPVLRGPEMGGLSTALAAALSARVGDAGLVEAALDGVEGFTQPFADGRAALARLSQNGERMLRASIEFVAAQKIARGTKMVGNAKRAFELRIKNARRAMEELAETLAPGAPDGEADAAPDEAGGR